VRGDEFAFSLLVFVSTMEMGDSFLDGFEVFTRQKNDFGVLKRLRDGFYEFIRIMETI